MYCSKCRKIMNDNVNICPHCKAIQYSDSNNGWDFEIGANVVISFFTIIGVIVLYFLGAWDFIIEFMKS